MTTSFPTGAATRSCALSSTRTSWPPTPTIAPPACRSCATTSLALSARPRALRAGTTSSCSAPTCWRPRWSSRARALGRSTCRAGAGWTCGARPATTRAAAGSRSVGRASSAAAVRRDLPAPLDELPLLARADTVLPLLSPDVDTLAATARARAWCELSDRRDRMQLLAFPRGRSSARFFAASACSRARAARLVAHRARLPHAALRPAGHALDARAPAAAVPRRAGRPTARASALELRLASPHTDRPLPREARHAVGARLLAPGPRLRPRRVPGARPRRTPPRSSRRTRPGHPGCGWTRAPGPPRPPRRPHRRPRCAGRS